MRYWMLTDEELRKIERVEHRLYSDFRMDGDVMRDYAQTLNAVRRAAVELPDDEVVPVDPRDPDPRD